MLRRRATVTTTPGRTVCVDLTPIRAACAGLERRVAELAGIADSVRALELRIRRLEVKP